MLPNGSSVANSKKLPLWLRWWGLLIGVVSLFWLPIEDTTLTMLGLISAGWGIWLAGWFLQREWFRRLALQHRVRQVLGGGMAGLLLPITAVFLAMIKAGLHGHGFLDFSFYQLDWLLVRTPLWVGLGCLGGWIIGSLAGEKIQR